MASSNSPSDEPKLEDVSDEGANDSKASHTLMKLLSGKFFKDQKEHQEKTIVTSWEYLGNMVIVEVASRKEAPPAEEEPSLEEDDDSRVGSDGYSSEPINDLEDDDH
ncbi:hypothetical protein L1987_24220 [Smallanthus sonchifolius]|uniref:Uncharacterized protein n=1 Tax=Smallanthus sonchifolius TaxID=185202 RepID=A0ACB9ILA4_9ASTR|nr:hypothetical protein L1987_24220 [Smallanthus sonchifolius]